MHDILPELNCAVGGPMYSSSQPLSPVLISKPDSALAMNYYAPGLQRLKAELLKKDGRELVGFLWEMVARLRKMIAVCMNFDTRSVEY